MMTGYARRTERATFMNREFADTTRMFRVLSNDRRLSILSHLTSGQMCTSDLISKIKIAPNTLFQHLRVLVNSGLVTSRREGKRTYYAISAEGRRKAMMLLLSLTTADVGQVDARN